MRFTELMNDSFTLKKRDGRTFEVKHALFTDATSLLVDDATLPVEEGDEIERALPSGLKEYFKVADRGFTRGFQDIPDHYQMTIHKIKNYS